MVISGEREGRLMLCNGIVAAENLIVGYNYLFVLGKHVISCEFLYDFGVSCTVVGSIYC